MAIGTPTVGTFTEFTAATSNAVPYPTVVNAGDCLVLLHTTKIAGFAVTSIDGSSVTGTAPNQTAGSWAVIQGSPTSDTASPSLCVAIMPSAVGTEGGTSLTVAHSNGVSSGQILAFSGVDNTTPQDVAAQVVRIATGSLSTTFPGVTIATAGAALVAAAAKNISTATATPPSGFTETGDRVSGTASVEFSYELGQGTGATGTELVSWNSGAISVGILLSLRPGTGGATGTLAATEGDDSLAASGAESFTGTLAATESPDTLASSGQELVTGSLSSTEGSDTLAASATETIAGTLASTESPDTLAAAGTSTIPGVTGTLSATEGADTLAAAGVEKISGTFAATEAPDALAASGTAGAAPVTGTLSATEAADTLAATGSEVVSGPLSSTEGNDTLAAVGTSTNGITGTLAATEANDTLAGSGIEAIAGSLHATDGNDTLTAAGAERISGTLAVVEAGDTLILVGVVDSGGVTVPYVELVAPARLGTLTAPETDRALTAPAVLRLLTAPERDALTAPAVSRTLTAPEV